MLKYFLLWFPMLLIAIANGFFREAVIKKHVGELAAHQLSTLTLVILFAFYIGFVIYKFPPASANEALLVGILWLVLTLCFEFGFGRYRGHSWEHLLADYNIFKGHLWVFIPLWLMMAPYVFFRWLYQGS
jgi:hypothetical protein